MNCIKCIFCTDYEAREDAGFCFRYPQIYVIDEDVGMMLTRPVISSSDWLACGVFTGDSGCLP